MHRSRTVLALVSVAALSLPLTGCGGDDTLSAKEFRSQAEKLCNAAEKDTDKIGEELSDSATEADLAKAIDKLVDRVGELADDIAALKPPKDLVEGRDDMIAAVRKGLDKVDNATAAELSAMEDPFADANEKAKKIGLDACAD